MAACSFSGLFARKGKSAEKFSVQQVGTTETCNGESNFGFENLSAHYSTSTSRKLNIKVSLESVAGEATIRKCPNEFSWF